MRRRSEGVGSEKQVRSCIVRASSGANEAGLQNGTNRARHKLRALSSIIFSDECSVYWAVR